MRHTRAIIDLGAIKHNIRILKERLRPGAGITAVVKANGYGHGAVEVARAALMAGARDLAVAIPEEGKELREAGITAPITILGLIAPEEALLCAESGLTVTVCHPQHLPPLTAAAQQSGRRINTLLKIDTGMGRIGADAETAAAMAEIIPQSAGLKWAGVFTHFASADSGDLTEAKRQLAQFKDILCQLENGGLKPPFISAAASAAAFSLPESQFDSVRLGIAMYGLYPSEEIRRYVQLRPALSLLTRISHIKKVPAGAGIGYGPTYRAQADEYIATLPLGYGDGYSRLLSNKAKVLINKEFYPIVGNICMDQMMISLGKETDLKTGDLVTLVGAQDEKRVTLEELAALVGTINYELACNISARVPRVYTE